MIRVMDNKGDLDEVMGIAAVLLAVDQRSG
jgi:hypothetical protein